MRATEESRTTKIVAPGCLPPYAFMLRSRLAVASAAARSSSHLCRRRTFLSSSSFSKKKMAGEVTPEGSSRPRASPGPRVPVPAETSFKKDGWNRNANFPQVPNQRPQTSPVHNDGMRKSSGVFCNGKSPQIATTQRTKMTQGSKDRKIRSFNAAYGPESRESAPRPTQTSLESIASNTVRGPESDALPSHFDIFKTRTTVGPVTLKKSLFEINRAKRKEAGQVNTVPQHLRPGMVLLKGYISHHDQVKITKKCRELGLGLGGFYRPGYGDGAKLHLHMMCLGLNWDPESRAYDVKRPFDGAKPPKIPIEFINLVTGSIQSSHNFLNAQCVDAQAEIPEISPDICIVNFYSDSGRLGLHQDRDEREESLRKGLPVVSFSIGDAAKFLYGEKRDNDKAKEVLLESGDVLIFGGTSRLIFHGVSSIIPKTAPQQLIEDTDLLPGRLNLTFRQY